MPTGVYKRTAYHIERLKARPKRIVSEATRRKISELKKGQPSPMLGKKHSAQTKRKMHLAAIGRDVSPMFTPQAKEKHRLALKKYIDQHPEIRILRAERMRGNKFRLGIKPSQLAIERARAKTAGPTGVLWKGDNVSYRGLHSWIEKKKGKADKCSINPDHYSSRYHWANISHEYKRDLDDWVKLCPRCHKKYDTGRMVLY